MKPKKNSDKDLKLKRGLYFVLGLLLILLLIYIVLEWKTTNDTNGYEIGSLPNKEILKNSSTIVLTTKTSNPINSTHSKKRRNIY